MGPIEEQCLLACCGLAEGEAAVFQPLDLPQFWQLVTTNAVEIQVCRALEKRGLEGLIPCDVRWDVGVLLEKNRQRAACFTEVLKELRKESIEVCLLKGAALGALIHEDVLYKKMNDIDVLFHQEDRKRVEEILFRMGFESVCGKTAAAGSHHTLPLFHRKSGTVVGLHWNLCDPKKYPLPLNWIWEETLSSTYSDEPIHVLSLEVSLLHLCIHLPFCKTGLRELADVCHLILFAESQKKGLDWELFFQRVHQCRAHNAVFRVLSLAFSLMEEGRSVCFPTDFIGEVSSFVRKETKLRQKHLLTSRFTGVTSVERWFLVYLLSGCRQERVRGAQEVLTALFNHQQTVLFGCKWPRPFPMLRVLALEHGWKKTLGSVGVLLFQSVTRGWFLKASSGRAVLGSEAFELFEGME